MFQRWKFSGATFPLLSCIFLLVMSVGLSLDTSFGSVAVPEPG